MQDAPRTPAKSETPASRVRKTKREAILEAALDLVVEGGFHQAPMSAIGKRANASAGVIYHHFTSKEEIFQAIYEKVCQLKRSSLLDGYDDSMDAREAFVQMAINAYAFYRQHQKELRYLTLCEDAGFPPSQAALPPTPEVIQFQRRFSSKAQGGVLADLPPKVLGEMSLGLIARLARDPKKLSPATVRQVAERIWRSLKA